MAETVAIPDENVIEVLQPIEMPEPGRDPEEIIRSATGTTHRVSGIGTTLESRFRAGYKWWMM